MNCKLCGTSNPYKARFCRKCGNELDDSNGNSSLLLIWIILLCLVGGLLVFIYATYSPTAYVSDDKVIDEIEFEDNKLVDASADIYFEVSIWYNHEIIADDSEKEYMKYNLS